MKKLLILTTAIIGMAFSSANAEQNTDKNINKTVKTECGACHMAFQPRFLPAGSWQEIMADLGNHFGEDATLDKATTKEITDYLVKHAGRKRKLINGKPPIRITKLQWFVGQHRYEVSKRAKKRAGTMSNCVACHRGAEKGWFEDE